jgi:hypothetical protein
MAEQWHLKGDWFDVCRCRVPCACTFAQAPDEEECNGILAWHITEGNYGDVPLDGLNVVMVGTFEGNIWAGEAKNSIAGFFVDERADEPSARRSRRSSAVRRAVGPRPSPRSPRPTFADSSSRRSTSSSRTT